MDPFEKIKPQLLGLAEACDIFAVDPNTLRRWCRDGKVQSKRLGRDWLVYEASLDKIVERREK